MSIPTIVLDRAASSSVHGGMLRITCNAIGGDGQEAPSGTLIIPAATAGNVLNGLIKMLQDLAAQQQAKLAQQPGSQAS